ncbi:ABC transporter ATP-binding protein [Halorarius halobius]|uniref:ABC transporter ATP-binding protein n=1 Tax=Halorarius halobius TaxID=2962671 RepID=UPI0020CC1860|nr:oligopeptide/dipeptide ABC transporter ATP-binding protein [Halorarius halobius]
MTPSRTDGPEEAPLLETESLTKHFDQSEGFIDRILGAGAKVQAVENVDLTVKEGETVAVVGESGCGKSTLVETIANLYTPTDGSVRFRGEDITGLSDRAMKQYRRQIQMIFQDPLASLNPRQTVGDCLMAPLEVHDIGDSDSERQELAKEHLQRVGLESSHFNRYPHEFSGGQQQRVAVARALTLEPDLLLADEPVSALDISVQSDILKLLERLQDELGIAIVFVSHDLSVVRYIADRVAVMYLGEIVELAPTDELFEAPRHPYTKALMSAIPQINPEDRADRIILEGSPPSPMNPPAGCRFHTRCPAVIPPEDWKGSQQQFRGFHSFRIQVRDGEIDPDAIRRRVQAESDETTAKAVQDQIIEESFDSDIESFPDEAREVIRTATEELVDGDRTLAVEAVDEAFRTPCEQQVPRERSAGRTHKVACHRNDSTERGDPDYL